MDTILSQTPEGGESLWEEGLERLALWITRPSKTKPTMEARHRHNAVEMNYVSTGGAKYLFGGRLVDVPGGRLAVFWGAIPHQTVELSPRAVLYSLHLPMAWFLEWHLAPGFVDGVLRGKVFIEQDEARKSLDAALFHEWARDFESDAAESRNLLLQEVPPRLQRMALALAPPCDPDWLHHKRRPPAAQRELTKVEAMASYIATHYTEPISVDDVARHVNLHPKYATTLFHRTCGVGLKQFITMNRVHHAQLLLLTTDSPVFDIMLQSGFKSLSRFYAVFKSVCGMSPKAYREGIRCESGFDAINEEN